MTAAPSLVVVGGGIAGLAAAWEGVRRGAAVTVVEAAEHLGGKIRTEPFDGVSLDTGPDAFLARVPWAVELCRELDLTDELVSPATGSAHLWRGPTLQALPGGLVLGVPAAAGPLARSGVLSPRGLLRAGLDVVLPGRPLDGDVAIGDLIRRRLGGEVHERLVDPLVGGINAGDTDRLSLDASVPQLAAVAHRHRSLVLGLRASRKANPPDPTAPVFHSLPDGLGRLVDRLVERLAGAGARLCTETPATALRPEGDRWALELASTGERVAARTVVLATPAFATAPLLEPHAPDAAAALSALEHASVVLVAFAYPAEAVGRHLDGSGFLVPRGEGRLMTACSWASSKWSHLARPGRVLLRVSAGRAGDDRALAMSDDELVARLHDELRIAMGVNAPPAATRVTRWERAFPQYAPGHLDRVAAIESSVAARLPGVALAGAAYRGVGIPACINSGRAATRALLGST